MVEKLQPFGLRISGQSFSKLMDVPVDSIEESLRAEGLVLIDSVQLSALQLKEFCNKFSSLESTDLEKSEDRIDGVLRVTSEIKDGRPIGIFGHESELGWHANRPSSRERRSIVCTYSFQGCDGSETWWSSPQRVFQDLDPSSQEVLRQIKAYFGYKPGTYTEEGYKPHKNQEAWPIVVERFGREGLYFPFNQIIEYESKLKETVWQPLISEIQRRVTSSEYTYKHRWTGHQIILSDQWTTIHCRPRCKMEGRKILRTTFNYSNDTFPF